MEWTVAILLATAISLVVADYVLNIVAELAKFDKDLRLIKEDK